MNNLVLIENVNPIAVFTGGGLDELLAQIEQEARSLVPDISTAKGRKEVASVAAKVARSKTTLDQLGKDLTADLKRQTNAVDFERRRMRDRLDALKEEVRAPLTAWEEADAARERARTAIIADIRSMGVVGSEDSSVSISERISRLETMQLADDDQINARNAALYLLSNALFAARSREEAQAKAEAELREQAEQARREREERIAREAAEAATKAAEAAAKREADRVERERQQQAQQAEAARLAAVREAQEAERRAMEAEQRRIREAAQAAARAKHQAEAAAIAERHRIEREAKAKAEADARRAADEAHRKLVKDEAIEDFAASPLSLLLTYQQMEDVFNTIASRKIRHIEVLY